MHKSCMLSLSLSLSLSLLTVLTAVVVQSPKNVVLEEQGFAIACVTISGASLARVVAVTVSTEDLSAIGKH